jgi:hypothetical protein
MSLPKQFRYDPDIKFTFLPNLEARSVDHTAGARQSCGSAQAIDVDHGPMFYAARAEVRNRL